MTKSELNKLIKDQKMCQETQDELYRQMQKMYKLINDAVQIQNRLYVNWNKENNDLTESKYFYFFSEKNIESKNNYKNYIQRLSENKIKVKKEFEKQKRREQKLNSNILKIKEQKNG